MATTTNYGWTTPDDTALVKDGAAAIRTLGSSVDTTTKALNPSTTLGDVEYRSSTANTNTRLGIGSTGQVLTVAGGVPTWATPAVSASGLTFVSTNSFSASNQVNVDNVFTSTYQQYKIFINITAISAATNIMFRLRVGGSTNSGNDYTFIGWDVNDAGGSGAAASTATSRLIQFAANTTAAGSTIEIFNPQQTLITKAFLQHTTGTQYRTMAGFTSVTTSYDGFSLVADVGETITGNYWVLGYQKS